MELRNSGWFSHLWQCHYRRCSSMFHGTKICFKKTIFFRKRGWTIFKIGQISLSIGRILLLNRPKNLTVTNATNTYIRGWMQMVYCYMIYSPETKQIRRWDIWIRCHGTLLLFTYKMVTVHRNYVLYAWWVLFVTPDSSFRLPCCSMGVLPPPLLVINFLSCSLPGGPGPPPFPPPGLTPFSSGSRHLPSSSSDTFTMIWNSS